MKLNCTAHIIIADPSATINEGLSGIILKSGINACISGADTMEEIHLIHLKRNCDVVIISPALIQNNIRPFQQMKNQMDKTKWVGHVYAYYDAQIMAMFDATLAISDSPEAIVSTIKRLLDTGPQKEQNQMQHVLSDRETDVLKLLATGMANKEIADRLNISTNTVISHRKNISQKTGIKSVSGLTIYAVVQKLINLENIAD